MSRSELSPGSITADVRRFEPLSRNPPVFVPQQYAAPELVSPQVDAAEDRIDTIPVAFMTETGIEVGI
jgi:hypothetical protein